MHGLRRGCASQLVANDLGPSTSARCAHFLLKSHRVRASRRALTETRLLCASETGGAAYGQQTSLSRSGTGVEQYLELLKQKHTGPASGPGHVYLIGTGPGDPGLLTLRAAQLMQSADVVLYDRLVSEDVLALVGGGARMIYVGKESGFHTRTQDEIHSMLLQFAEAGATVVRLKGGDPYVFGRGGEEVAYLSARGIQVHCVPGITAAAGICAELGIPMTHRGVATSVRFLTGHAREGGEEALDAAIAAAPDAHTTLIVYMGLQTLPTLTAQLTGGAGGLPAGTPAVAVERGTTVAQRVVYGELSQLQHLTKAAGLVSPTLLIIGEVVGVSQGWQEWRAAGSPLVFKGAAAATPVPGVGASAPPAAGSRAGYRRAEASAA